MALTALIAATLLSPNPDRTTSNSSFSAAASESPDAAAPATAATGAAAETPHSSSSIFTNSTTSIMDFELNSFNKSSFDILMSIYLSLNFMFI